MKVLFWMFIGFDKHETSEHLLTAVIEQLCKAGHSVHILQKDTGGDLPSIPECLSNYPITTDTIPVRSVNKGNFAARYLAELKYISKCKRYITAGYDAVFVQSTTVGGYAVAALRKKLPHAIITFNVQDIFPYNAVYSGKIKEGGMLFRFLASKQRIAYKKADHIITISEDMKETLVEDGVNPNKISVIYNWSYQDDPYDNLDLTPVSHMFDKEKKNIVYAGNIGVMQNVDIIIETARLMKNEDNICFQIIGNGVYKAKLEEKAKEYELNNITFWPLMDPSFAPLIYTAADINVIPLAQSIYKTALPSKTATCIACSRPIIFAIGKDSLFGEKMKRAVGYDVVESNNSYELVDSIHKLLNEPRVTMQDEFFLKFFGKSENSKKYCDIIASLNKGNIV